MGINFIKTNKPGSNLLAARTALAALPVRAQYDPPQAGLVAWWRGESNALDSVGGHDGTVQNGVTFEAGKFGQAFSFGPDNNPPNTHVVVPDSEAFKLTNSLSISAWIYAKGTGGYHI